MGAKNAMHSINIIPKNASGINDISTAKSLNVYPNPANDELNIDLKGEKIETTKIISINGQLMFQSTAMNSKINISQLPANIYFVETKTANNIYRTKFVKE